MMERGTGLGTTVLQYKLEKSCTCNSHIYIPVKNVKTELPKLTEFTAEFTEGHVLLWQEKPDMPKWFCLE